MGRKTTWRDCHSSVIHFPDFRIISFLNSPMPCSAGTDAWEPGRGPGSKVSSRPELKTEVEHGYSSESHRASGVTLDINSWQCSGMLPRTHCLSFFWAERRWRTHLPGRNPATGSEQLGRLQTLFTSPRTMLNLTTAFAVFSLRL